MTYSPRPSLPALLLAFAAVYLLWGSTYLAARFGLETLPPFLLAGARFLLAGALMTAFALARGARLPGARGFGAALLIGGLMMSGGNGLVVKGQSLGVPSGVAALLVATMPLFMALLGAFFFGTGRLDLRTLAGIALGFGGVALLVLPGRGEAPVDLFAAALVVLAGFNWALGSLLARGASLPRSLPLAVGMEMLAGGLLLVVFGTLAGEWAWVDAAAFTPRALGALAWLVVAGSIAALSAYVWLLRVVSPAAASTYAFVNPVVAVVLGFLFAGEALDARVGVAALLVVASVATILEAGRRQRAEAARDEDAARGGESLGDDALVERTCDMPR